MGAQTGIEFCHHTLNPWWGCTKVHEGCANCYAEGQVKRFDKSNWGPRGDRRMIKGFRSEAIKLNRKAGEAGERRRVLLSMCDPFEEFDGRVVDNKGDNLSTCMAHECGVISGGLDCPGCASPVERGLFRPTVLADLRELLFIVIDETPNLDWLLFTKRPENIQRMSPPVAKKLQEENFIDFDGKNVECYRRNVWLVTSVSTQSHADKMIPELLKCRDLAPVLGVSYEPALGHVDFSKWIPSSDGFVATEKDGPIHTDDGGISLDWIVAGGESGPNARPAHPDWFRSVRDECEAAGVPFFFKQWGEWIPWSMTADEPLMQSQHGLTADAHVKIPPDLTEGNANWDDGLSYIDHDFREGQMQHAIFEKVGKKSAGRLLDGEECNGLPKRPPSLFA